MKLELILPKRKNVGRVSKAPAPHLGLGMVAALTPKDADISLTDERIAAIDFKKDIDLVGISATTTTAPRASEIADAFRAKGVGGVLGGIHPSILPEEASQHADAVVIGEAEGVWPKVIDDFKAGRLKSFYSQQERPSLAGLPLPRRADYLQDKEFIVRMADKRICPGLCVHFGRRGLLPRRAWSPSCGCRLPFSWRL